MSAKLLSASSVLILVCLITHAGYAAAPATRPTTQQVKLLVDLLSNDDWKIRQKAMDDLTLIGPLAEAELRRRLDAKPDPETVTAIEALLAQIAEAGKQQR